jgi:hypothetical protein
MSTVRFERARMRQCPTPRIVTIVDGAGKEVVPSKSLDSSSRNHRRLNRLKRNDAEP